MFFSKKCILSRISSLLLLINFLGNLYVSSARIAKTQGSEGEIMKSRNVKKFFTFGEQKLFTRQLPPDSSRSGQKASWGWPFRIRGKHARKKYGLNSGIEMLRTTFSCWFWFVTLIVFLLYRGEPCKREWEPGDHQVSNNT